MSVHILVMTIKIAKDAITGSAHNERVVITLADALITVSKALRAIHARILMEAIEVRKILNKH
jgi:hypothetical protein